MTRLIYCEKLKKEAQGLSQPPWPGELGKRIFDSISAEAWQAWVAHQTILINDNRLSMIDPKSRAFIMQEMEKFLFGEGSDKPQAFTPTD